MIAYRQHVFRLLGGAPLAAGDAEGLMAEILDGALPEVATAAVLTAIAQRGVTGPELAGFASAMRARVHAVRAPVGAIDTCGTGGSGLDTINTSTLAGLVVAAEGVAVAKHGNRSSSGRCGSMDVLEALGVDVDVPPDRVPALFARSRFVFLNARRHHPALAPLGAVRKALGFRTVFNLLGPICNPAGVRRQLVGVSDPEAARLVARALADLGTERAMVVSAHDRLDELSPCGPTMIFDVEAGRVRASTLEPSEVGLEPISMSAIEGGSKQDNLRAFVEVLEGRGGPRAQHVALNAGAALLVAGRVESLREGVARAARVLDSGAALAAFETYRRASQERAA